MTSATFPLLELPGEIRLLIFDCSFAIREAPFQYRPRELCAHNNLQMRDIVASGDHGEHSCNRVRDVTFDGCSRRVRVGQTGFLALRLTSRQIYMETYHLIKLPPIRLREFRLQINEVSINSFIQQADKAWIRDHTKEVSIGWMPICKHLPGQQQVRERSCYSTFATLFQSLLRSFWDPDATARQARLCAADQGATIRSLAELLAIFPRLETVWINVVSKCRFEFSMAAIGNPEVFTALRNRGVVVHLI